jgi:hypothetical protein
MASQKVRKETQEIEMSKQYSECPLYNHANCREIDNRKICAIVREDKNVLRSYIKIAKQAKE